jgi:hypothetical protein
MCEVHAPIPPLQQEGGAWHGISSLPPRPHSILLDNVKKNTLLAAENACNAVAENGHSAAVPLRRGASRLDNSM